MYIFDEIFERMKIVTESKNDNQLSIALNLTSNSVITGWKKREKIPDKRINQMCFDYGINKDWLMTGNGHMYIDSPLDNPTIASLVELIKISSSTNIELPFKYFNPLIEVVKEIVFVKNILTTLERIQSLDPEQEDIQTSYSFYPINSIFDLLSSEHFLNMMIGFFFDTIKSASYEYFSDIESFYLAFEDQRDILDKIIEVVGYDKSSPKNKKITEKVIFEFVQNHFRFESPENLKYLKNNIELIESKWEDWKKFKTIAANNAEYRSLEIEYLTFIDTEEYLSFEEWWRNKYGQTAYFLDKDENLKLMDPPDIMPFEKMYIDGENIEMFEDPWNFDSFYILTEKSKRIYYQILPMLSYDFYIDNDEDS